MQENQITEFKESWREEWLKWICGFANSEGGTMYIGINDKGQVVGLHNAHKLAETIPQTAKHLLGIIVEINIITTKEGLDYLEIMVDKYITPLSYRGKYYVRIGRTNLEVSGLELDKFMLKKLGVTWDSIPYKKFDIDDLDKDAIKYFRDKALKSERLTEEDLNVDDKILLEKLHLYEEEYLTNATILLFHKKQEEHFTGSTIKIAYFEFSEIKYQDEIGGPLIKQVDETIYKIYDRYLKGLIWYEGIFRREEYMFPKEALREILLNAVNNKVYNSGVPIQIRVYEDEIFIYNVGTFPKEITPVNVYEQHQSKPYNPKLAGVFFKSGMIESWGRGFEKIKNICQQNDVPLPIVENQGGETVMIHILPSKKYMEIFENSNLSTKNITRNDGQDGLGNLKTHKKRTRNAQETHKKNVQESAILKYCKEAKTIKEITDYFGFKNVRNFRENYTNPLLEKGLLKMTIPNQRTNRNQKYITNINKEH